MLNVYRLHHDPTGVELEFWARDDRLGRVLGRGRFYEGDMLEDIRRRQIPGAYLDVGAFIGTHSVYFAELCPACAQVVAIEPCQSNYDILVNNLVHNMGRGCNRPATAVHAAAGMTDGMCSITPPAYNMGMGMAVLDHRGSIPMVTLDSLADQLAPVGLLKIDVEGGEAEVLAGASRILAMHPHVYLEMADDLPFHRRYAAMRLLHEAGYGIDAVFNKTPTYHAQPISTTTTTPALSVVMPYYGTREYLEKTCFPNLPRHDQVELILVDDGCAEPVASYAPEWLKVITMPQPKVPWNLPTCFNRGAVAARGKYLLMTAVDHLIQADDIPALLSWLSSGAVKPFKFYGTFARVDSQNEGKLLPGTGIIVMDRREFLMIGGYDEQYSGHYGCGGNDLRRRLPGQEIIVPGVLMRFNIGGEENTLPRDQFHNREKFTRGPRIMRHMLEVPPC